MKLRAAALLFAAMAACGGTPRTPEPKDTPLAIEHVVDLAPAAGLDSLVVLEPRAVLAHAELLPILDTLIPDERFRKFAARNGGVDPRQLDELVIASYAGGSTLVLGRGVFEPARVESAFGNRVTRLDSRTVDKQGGLLSTIVRLDGSGASGHEEVVLFGRQALGLELGPPHAAAKAHAGPLRAAGLFAEGRLKKASPALRGPPLDATATDLGPAPARIFFAGPFQGGAEEGFAGLLKGATAVGVALEPAPARPDGKPALHATLVLSGAWGEDAEKAGERLVAAVNTLANSALGKLCGVNQPFRGPDVRTTPTALFVDLVVDAEAVARGVRAATGAEVDEIMRF